MNKKFFAYFFISLFGFLTPYVFFSLEGLLFSVAIMYGGSFVFTIIVSLSYLKNKIRDAGKILAVVSTPFIVVDIMFLFTHYKVIDYTVYIEFYALILISLYLLIASFVLSKIKFKETLKALF